MYSRFIRFIGAVGCVTVVACAPSEDAGDTAEAGADEMVAIQPVPITQQEVDAQTDAFIAAVRNGDTTALGSVYAADASMVSARGKLDGNEAIVAFWTEATKGGAGKSLETQPLKFGSSGDLAWSLNRFTGGVTAPAGHTLRVFQRQPDGSIKTLVQLSIPDVPAR